MINLADLIRRQHANAKYWFVSWKKNKDFTLLDKIRDTIKVLKELLSKVNSSSNYDDRITVVAVKKEVEEMESTISKTPVFTSK